MALLLVGIHTFCDGGLLYRMGLAQVVGKELSDFFPADFAAEKTRYYRRAWQGEQVTYECRVPGGIIGLVTLYPVKTNGQVAEVIALCTDITDHRRAEELLRRSEERLRLALETGDLGVGHSYGFGRLVAESGEAPWLCPGYLSGDTGGLPRLRPPGGS